MAALSILLDRIRWTIGAPLTALVVLAFTWGSHPEGIVLLVVAVLLVVSVLAAVHHAEIVAHRVGEPFGSLILAVAVTVIEVGLILSLMAGGGKDTSELARDTVFAAVMITINGIAGLSLLVSALKYRFAVFNPEGTGAALATVVALAALCLVLPTFTTGAAGPEFTSDQLAFAAVASLSLYVLFVFTQTVRHRDFFMPVSADGRVLDVDGDGHADPPTNRATIGSLALLVVALVSVVGLAKVASGAIEDAVAAVGAPQSFVGVIIALLVLLPESIAAVRNAAGERVQISLNLAYGSAMASIGLTIPALAVASIWIETPLSLGLQPTQVVLLVTSVLVSTLTVVTGRSKPLQGGVHLVLFAAFIFLSISP